MSSALLHDMEIWLVFLNVTAIPIPLFKKTEDKLKLTESKPK